MSKFELRNLQSIASEGCRRTQDDPERRWWTIAANRDGAKVPDCWQDFEKAVAGLNVQEDWVAGCEPGGVSVTVKGIGLPPEGASIYLEFAYGACTREESRQRAKEAEGKGC